MEKKYCEEDEEEEPNGSTLETDFSQMSQDLFSSQVFESQISSNTPQPNEPSQFPTTNSSPVTKEKTEKKMSKLYYHAMNHAYLMLRKIAPKTTEMQESTWSQDRKDFYFVPEKRIEEVMIYKNSIRNYFKSLSSKKFCDKTSSKKSNNKYPEKIEIDKWMMMDEEGNLKPRFIYLLKLLADIPNQNISWGDKLVFECKDAPGKGPSDMVFPLVLNEDQVFAKIEERMKQHGRCEQIQNIFRDGLVNVLKRKDPEWWIYSPDLIDNVCKDKKKKFLAFCSKKKILKTSVTDVELLSKYNAFCGAHKIEEKTKIPQKFKSALNELEKKNKEERKKETQKGNNTVRAKKNSKMIQFY